MDSGGFCLLCGKRLKTGTIENKKKTVFHQKCFNLIISDFNNFHKIAEEKYDYKEIICGKTKEEWRTSEDPLILHFD